MTKYCYTCGEYRDLTEFHNTKRTKDGKQSRCVYCVSEYHQQYYVKNKNAIKVKTSEWHTNNKEKYKQSRKIGKLQSRYGISIDTYNTILVAQKGLCAICKFPPNEEENLCVDHCHETNKIRGLLCKPCNLLIGNANNDVARLLSAVHYLVDGEVV